MGIALLDASQNGGSEITLYEIQYDDGNRGDYSSVFQLHSQLYLSAGVERGAHYRFKYRAQNFNGWGPFSEVAYIKAATKPEKPLAPVLVSASEASISLQFATPENLSGEPLTGFKLYVDTITHSSNYAVIYEGSDWQVTLTAGDGLLTGTTYRFVLVSTNSYGDSPMSEQLRVAFASLPSTPNAPQRVASLSTQTSIAVEWAAVPGTSGVPVSGYYLYMDDGLAGPLQLIYNGANKPFTYTYTAYNLRTGLPYRFKVLAENINGLSQESETATYYACMEPQSTPAPKVAGSTKTSLTIEWEEPQSNGCPVTGFEIFRNSGEGDAIAISVDSLSTVNSPSLRLYEIGGLVNTGNKYRIKVRAFNQAGSTDSAALSVVLAAVPDTPLTGPHSDASVTNERRIKVDYAPLATSQNGGSAVLSYELQVDNGMGGDFTSLIGFESASLETSFTLEENVTSGSIFRFRYRCKNVNGWSEYSPISHVKAATSPERPPRPQFVTADASSLQIQLFEST